MKVWALPEIVDNALEVSWDQHNQGDDCGEDQGWRRSQSVDVSHRQNFRLYRSETTSERNLGIAVSIWPIEEIPHHVPLSSSNKAYTATAEEGAIQRSKSRQGCSEWHDPAPAAEHLGPGGHQKWCTTPILPFYHVIDQLPTMYGYQSLKWTLKCNLWGLYLCS